MRSRSGHDARLVLARSWCPADTTAQQYVSGTMGRGEERQNLGEWGLSRSYMSHIGCPPAKRPSSAVARVCVPMLPTVQPRDIAPCGVEPRACLVGAWIYL